MDARKSPPASIDAYIAAARVEVQEILKKIRRAIAAAREIIITAHGYPAAHGGVTPPLPIRSATKSGSTKSQSGSRFRSGLALER